jgi:predicted nuclease of predicted toxin-antitoxin system
MALFLADECLFTSTVRLLRDLGVPVQRVQELGMTGASDGEVFRYKRFTGC